MNLLNEGGEVPAAVVAAHVGHLSAPTVVEHLAKVLQLLHASTQKKIDVWNSLKGPKREIFVAEYLRNPGLHG
jgi:hypothetical protein